MLTRPPLMDVRSSLHAKQTPKAVWLSNCYLLGLNRRQGLDTSAFSSVFCQPVIGLTLPEMWATLKRRKHLITTPLPKTRCLSESLLCTWGVRTPLPIEANWANHPNDFTSLVTVLQCKSYFRESEESLARNLGLHYLSLGMSFEMFSLCFYCNV